MVSRFKDMLKQFLVSQSEPAPKPLWLKWGGVILITLSFLLYGALLALPFIPISIQDKVVVSSILVILAEGVFLMGGLILGKQVVGRYKQYLNLRYWLCRKSPRTETK